MRALTPIVLLVLATVATSTAAEVNVTGIYKARRGDTPNSIATRFRMKTEDLAALNRSVKFDELQVGQPIKVRLRKTQAELLYPTIPPQVAQ